MSDNVVPLFDKLVDLVTGLGGRRDRTVSQSFGMLTLISEAEIAAMYRSDWIARKLVDIVPEDMVRTGRRWKADKDQITAIENAENLPTISLWPKVKTAITRARLMGGAAIFIGVRGQSSSSELDVASVQKDDLQYLTVISKGKLTYSEIDQDPQSVWYGEPKMWQVQTGVRTIQIHPSRLVRFTGPLPLTEDAAMSRDSLMSGTDTASDGVWGDPLLQIVYDAVKNAASSQQHIAGLIPDARNDVIYIPGLGAILQSPSETEKLTKRFSYARDMKSMFNLLLLEGNGVTGVGTRGEEWKQRQVSFTQLPEVLRAFLEIAAAAADIPITRFLGQSPGGLNSTGDSDMRNYYDHVGAQRTLVLGPALYRLDEVNIRSALGSRPPEIFYEWPSLWSLNETEKAEIFVKKADGARKIAGNSKDLPLMDLRALSEGLVNSLVEDGNLPGLESAIDKFGDLAAILGPDDMVPKEPVAPVTGTPAPVASKSDPVKDAAPRTLYVRRQLLNTSEFVKWAHDQGFENILPSDQLHVTVLYSKTPVDWIKMGQDMWSGDKGKLTVPAGGPRVVEPLGPTATVLLFSATMLAWRHQSMIEAGASSDFEEFTAHVTISHSPQKIDLNSVVPFRGELRFGPEIFEEVNPNWKAEVLS